MLMMIPRMMNPMTAAILMMAKMNSASPYPLTLLYVNRRARLDVM